MAGTIIGADQASDWRAALRRSAVRAGVLGSSAVVLSTLQHLDPQRRLFVCPLRALTGIPCPLCGGTTAAISLARLDIREALLASPLAVIGGLVVVIAPLMFAVRRTRPLSGPVRTAIAATVLAAAQVWQLIRLSGG